MGSDNHRNGEGQVKVVMVMVLVEEGEDDGSGSRERRNGFNWVQLGSSILEMLEVVAIKDGEEVGKGYGGGGVISSFVLD